MCTRLLRSSPPLSDFLRRQDEGLKRFRSHLRSAAEPQRMNSLVNKTRPLGFPPRFGPGSPWACTEARVALRGRHKGGGERLRAPSAACHPLCLAAQAASALVNAGARHVGELARLGTRARVALGQRDVAVDVLDQPLRRRLRGSLSSLLRRSDALPIDSKSEAHEMICRVPCAPRSTSA